MEEKLNSEEKPEAPKENTVLPPSGEGVEVPVTSPAKTAEGADKPKPKPSPAPKDPRDKLYKPERPLIISSSPHFHTGDSVPKIMWTVVAALIPATAMAIYYFGTPAIIMIAACVAAALVTEIIMNKMKGEALTISDGSAAITGLLLALTLPPSLPVSAGIIGSVFSIAVGKQIFGGLGYNIFNPALLGRAFLQASFPVAMTTWTYPDTDKYATIDAVTAATPLGQFKFEKTPDGLW